jgi:uncharacterized membrane protein
MDGAERRSRGWSGTTRSAPDVGLVVAAATAPGTFAPSRSPRSAVDQGLVTGLGTGLQFLLTAGAQDALVAVARFLTGGGPSPTAQRGSTIVVDCAAVPLGLAVLGATGLAGALLGGAEAGARALDDRLRLGIPAAMRWRPLTTFFQSLVDMKNAQTQGAFGAFQHDYRSDLPRFLSDVFGLPASEEQLHRIEETLEVRETVREKLFSVVPGAVG